uniref:Zinc finger protein CONSTANS-LIKE 3 n=1 Tax=Cajanus cajan TaxID=3821 RepID=A0A151SAU5_CAJCA|nr:Zinc finger protein CONSTANS-LIKE 3 [Cajanus cajan]
MGFYGGFQNFNSRYQPHVGEFGEECCGFVEDIKPPAYPNTARENWGIQGNQMAAVEEPNIKVGRYSEEERKERILRYLKKRNQRNFNKTIKYACRKTLADRRVRVRGRFARNNELCEEDMATKKHENDHHHKEDFYGGDSIQFQKRESIADNEMSSYPMNNNTVI